MSSSRSKPIRVLIVEDEFFIAEDLFRILREDGMAIAGPVADLVAASTRLNGEPIDFAVLDINLDGSITFEVAAMLRRLGIPFLFLTGYDTSVVPAEFADAVFLRKPHDAPVVVDQIRRHFACRAANTNEA